MEILNNSSNVNIHDSLFVENTYRVADPNIGESGYSACGSWLDSDNDEARRLLNKATLFDAAYNSAAQEDMDPPLPATQHRRLIEALEDLITGGELSLRALVFSGPRSNLGHLCAKRLEDNLCASFFVSQVLQTDNYIRFFPTLACQLSEQFPAYAVLLEKELRYHPSILHTNLRDQFQKLIAQPFRQLLSEGQDFGQRRVIVINGLEEYANVQTRLKILHAILEGAEELPFIWLIFGQPDKASDKYVAEVGPTVELWWGEGYSALETRAWRTMGTVHCLVLLHSGSCFITSSDFQAKSVTIAITLFFF